MIQQQIPPNLPFPKGGPALVNVWLPPFKKGGMGGFVVRRQR